VPWTGQVAWSDKIAEGDRKKLLELLKLPETTGPAQWWLTEFEDPWPYRPAVADLTFARDADQSTIKRPPIIQYVVSPMPTDVMMFVVVGIVVLPPLLRRTRRAWK